MRGEVGEEDKVYVCGMGGWARGDIFIEKGNIGRCGRWYFL